MTNPQELVELMADLAVFLDSIADGAEDTDEYEDDGRIWAWARDRATEALRMLKDLHGGIELPAWIEEVSE